MYGLLVILSALVALTWNANAGAIDPRNEIAGGLEVNLLWAVPPINTYEIRAFVGVSPSVQLGVGYGGQFWTYTGDQLNPGSIHSHALILGARYFIDRSRTFVDAATWLMDDHFTTPSGAAQNGPAISHEFFVGHQVGGGQIYWAPGMNVGFYSYRDYAKPKDDRFKLTILPKIASGVEFK